MHHHTIRVPRFRDNGSQRLHRSRKCNEIAFKSLSEELHILQDLFHYEFTFKLNVHGIKSSWNKTASVLPLSTALPEILGQGWRLRKTGLSFHCRSWVWPLTITSQEVWLQTPLIWIQNSHRIYILGNINELLQEILTEQKHKEGSVRPRI